MSQRRSAATPAGGAATRPASLAPNALPALHSASGTAAASSARAAVSAAHDDASPPSATLDIPLSPMASLGSPQPRGSSNKPSFRDSKEQPHPPHSTPSPPMHASQGGSNARISSHKLLDLEEEILAQKSSLQRKDEYISGLQRNCETLSALCAKHMQQVALLKSDFDRVSVEKFVLENETGKFQSNAALAEKLIKENEELVASGRRLTAQVESLQTKVYITQNQISDLAEQKEDLVTDLARERGLHANCKLEVEELRQIMMADSSSRRGGAGGAAVTSTTGKANHAEIEHRISSLKHEYETNKAALEELQAAHKALQLAHTKAGNVAARVAQESDSLSQDNARLKKGMAQLRKEQAETKEIAQLHATQNEQLRAAYDALAAEHAYATQRLPEVESSLRSSEKARASLKKQHDEVWSTKEDLLLQLAELRADGEVKQKQQAALANQPSALEIAQAGETALLQAERVSLVQQLSAAQQRLRELEVQLADSDTSLLRWQGKYDAAVREKAELTRQLNEADAQSKQLQDSLRSAALGEQGGRDALQAQIAAQQAAYATANAAAAAELAAAKKLADSAAASIAAADAAAASARADLASQAQKHAAELADLKAKADAFVAARLAESDRAASKQQAALMAAQHRTSELEAILDQPRLSAGDLSKLAAREKELQACVAKLVVNEEASEASFTCFSCVGVFNKPVTCIPCGHSYCLGCIQETNMCTQCKPPTKVTYYANELLEELASRFIFRKQALQTLKSMTQQTPGSLR